MNRGKPIRQRVPATVAREAQPGRSGLFTLALLTWWIGGYGLVMYGTIADRGPFAFLIDLPAAMFGGGNIVLGALAGAVFVFWGPPLLAHLYLRLRPDSSLATAFKQRMSLAMMSRGQAAEVARVRWEGLDDATRQALLRRRRNGALIFVVVCLAGSWGAATYIRASARADAGRPLAQLALHAGAVSLDGAGRWVRVTNATALIDASIVRAYAIRGTAHRDVYTPLVPPDWHTGDRVFLVEEDDMFPDDPAPAAANPPGPVEGEISLGGPRPDIARKFAGKGYEVGDWTAVLRRVPTLHGVVPAEDGFVGFLIWWIGGFFALLSLLVAIVAEVKRRALAAQVS